MSSNQENFLANQYRDATNLNARGNLHARYRANPRNWFLWVFDRFDLPQQCRILELGCGPAGLWLENLERIPMGWNIVLSDLSAGMVQAAKRNLNGSEKAFEFRVFDAQSIPYPDKAFDAVVANHMLYHVPDLKRCIIEIYRVLKSNGKFYAATNGKGHHKEINDLTAQWLPKLAVVAEKKMTANRFTLENGEAKIKPPFHNIRADIYEDVLEVTQAEPLLAYILSTDSNNSSKIDPGEVDALKDHLEKELAEKGSIHITKSTGMFVASKIL